MIWVLPTLIVLAIAGRHVLAREEGHRRGAADRASADAEGADLRPTDGQGRDLPVRAQPREHDGGRRAAAAGAPRSSARRPATGCIEQTALRVAESVRLGGSMAGAARRGEDVPDDGRADGRGRRGVGVRRHDARPRRGLLRRRDRGDGGRADVAHRARAHHASSASSSAAWSSRSTCRSSASPPPSTSDDPRRAPTRCEPGPFVVPRATRGRAGARPAPGPSGVTGRPPGAPPVRVHGPCRGGVVGRPARSLRILRPRFPPGVDRSGCFCPAEWGQKTCEMPPYGV